MRLEPFKARPLESESAERLDLLVGALGYELRSREIPFAYRDAAARTVLIDFKSEGEFSYDENRRAAIEAGFELVDFSPELLSGWLLGQLEEIGARERRDPHIAIDVSSLTRDRIAYLVDALRRFDEGIEHPLCPAVVDLLYTPAEPPKKNVEPERIEVLGPVTSGFAGFAPDVDSPVVAFVGLGIEQDRAIGALEYIEPATTWVFVPHGENEQFDEKVKHANSWIWMAVDDARQIRYLVDDPFSLYTTLEQLVASESAGGRPILVPLGPKIFATCCLLVASGNPRAGVWRVSAGIFGRREDCESGGKLVGLRLGLG